MAEPASGPIVLIVDNDLGFAFWLGEILVELGYRAIPALDCRKALSLTRGLDLKINVIVLNLSLPGISTMMRSLRRLNPNVKVIAIIDEGADAAANLETHAMLKRPSGMSPISRQEWIRRVRQSMRDLEISDSAG